MHAQQLHQSPSFLLALLLTSSHPPPPLTTKPSEKNKRAHTQTNTLRTTQPRLSPTVQRDAQKGKKKKIIGICLRQREKSPVPIREVNTIFEERIRRVPQATLPHAIPASPLLFSSKIKYKKRARKNASAPIDLKTCICKRKQDHVCACLCVWVEEREKRTRLQTSRHSCSSLFRCCSCRDLYGKTNFLGCVGNNKRAKREQSIKSNH